MKPNTTELMKFKRLCRRLNDGTRGIVGLLELLWQGTAKNCPQGDVGRLSNEEIAIMCDWAGCPDDLVAALIETAWLDASQKHRLLVHDWCDHAPSYVLGNLRRWKKEFAREEPPISNDPEPVPDTPSSPSLSLPSLPPPPPPLPPAEPADPEWAEAEEDLLSLGLARAAEAVQWAKCRDCQPIDIRRVISHYRSKPDAWGPGALLSRIECLRHNQDPAALWPPPSKAAAQVETSAERERVAAQAAAQRDDGEHRVANRRAEVERLEAAHGAAVNELTREEVEAIIGKRIKNWQRLYRLPASGKASSGTVRFELLSHFESIGARVP